MFSPNATNGGFVRLIIIIVIALLIISFFGYSLRNLAESPTTKDNFSFVWDTVSYVWNTFLKGPAVFIWNLFLNYIWEPAIHNLQNMKDNQPSDIQSASPRFGTAPTVN